MNRKYSEAIFVAAKKLRKNETIAEKIMWNELRNKKVNGLKFRRQVPYDRFILDFLCPKKKLIIEIDGSSHNGFEEKDKERDHYFISKGYTVLRFSNDEVINYLEKVLNEIRNLTPTLSYEERELLPS